MIYKPTDLSPSAQTFDVMDTPIFFECKVDTSNVQARGFTIKVLDSENNVVFSSIPYNGRNFEPLSIDHITLIDDLKAYVDKKFPSYVEGYNLVNTGYNGTYLRIPFSVAKGDRVTNSDEDSKYQTVSRNQVYYDSDTQRVYAYSPDETSTALDIYNGQEYKWSITLYQLEDKNEGTGKRAHNWQLPDNPLFFDMPLTNGTVLGSNNIRIQSVLSQEIYSDYFVQPVKIENLEYDPANPTVWNGGNISQEDSNRVMIKSYDNTYGYIYPQTGENGFAEETITPDISNGFQIYKRGNNKDNLTAYQQVAYVFDTPLDNVVPEEWSSNDSYDLGDIVSYNNVLYQAIKNIPAHRPKPIDTSSWEDYYGPSWQWKGSSANPGESYGIYTDYALSDPKGVYEINEKTFVGNERTVLNAQKTDAAYSSPRHDNDGPESPNYLGSPYNGIYYPQFSVDTIAPYDEYTYYNSGDIVTFDNQNYKCTGVVVGENPKGNTIYWASASPKEGVSSWELTGEYTRGTVVKITEQGTTTYYSCKGVVYKQQPAGQDDTWWKIDTNARPYKITVNWLRTPDADSWGELMNKIVLVTDPNNDSYYGKNIQIKDINENADAYGTINQTPFKFVLEEPIEIYKNSYPLFSYNTAYKKGSVVRWTKPGLLQTNPGSYETYNSSNTYQPGTVVWYDSKHYICIKTAGPNKNPDNADYWSLYKAQSYYVAINDVPDSGNTVPIGSQGIVNDYYWAENPRLGDTGLIFYNNALGHPDDIQPSTENGRLYIRKFEGIQPGMMLMKNSTTNEQEYLKIETYNSDYSFVTYDETYKFNTYDRYAPGTNPETNPADVLDGWDPANQNGIGTKYQIKTFFRESDENAFYFYNRPTVTLHYANSNGLDYITDRVPTPKYYSDYKEEIEKYDPSVQYAKDDVVFSSTDPIGYYRATKDNPLGGVSSGSWEADSSWSNPEAFTTTYNKYFTYDKDDIVLYNNKNDFLLYSSTEEYSYYDKVRYANNGTTTYYISQKNNNMGKDPSSAEGSSYWSSTSVSDPGNIYYIAKRNIPKDMSPSGNNIGSYWEQYIGVLFESEGFVNAEIYQDNKEYEEGSIVLYKGLYYYIDKKNESITVSGTELNEQNELVWEKATTFSEDADYDINAFEWFAGALKHKTGAGDNSWELYNGPYDDVGGIIPETLYFKDGLAYEGSSETGPKYSNFSSTEVYQNGQDLFYEGYLYRVIAASSGHVPAYNRSTDYFKRVDDGKPFGYPKIGRRSVSGTGENGYLMGDVVLAKGDSSNILPDRYYVKINNSHDDQTSSYIPDLDNWQKYTGPLYSGDYESSKEGYYGYNNTVLNKGDGLYYIQKNISSFNSSYDISPTDPTSESVTVWTPRKTYQRKDKVLYNNVLYVAVNNDVTTRPSTNSQNWAVYPWQLYIPEITERTLKVSAEYDQQQYIQWKSAQWFLFDATGEEVLDKSDVFYDGDLTYTFHGLEGREKSNEADKFFIVRLILETYTGYRFIIDETIEVMFTVTEVDSEGLLSTTFDCDTLSVVTNITKESGFIIPSSINNAEYTLEDDGMMLLSGQMEYEKVAPSIENAALIAKAQDLVSAAERFVAQADITIDTDKIGGDLFSIESTNGETKVGFTEFLSVYDNYPNDEVLSEGLIQVNPDRLRIVWAAKQEATAYDYNGLDIYPWEAEGDEGQIDNPISSSGDTKSSTDFGWTEHKTIPLWQSSSFNPLSGRVNYLDVAYEITGSFEHDPDSNNEKGLLNITLPYSIYTTEPPQKSPGAQDFHVITQPLVYKAQFSSTDNTYASTSSGTIFKAYNFMVTSEDNEGSNEIYVRGNTSTMWSDYSCYVPNKTLVGEDIYTKKNVWRTEGWKWSDASSDPCWIDGDCITNSDEYSYNSILGELMINGSLSETEEVYEGASIKFDKSLFKPQKKIEQVLRETGYLKGKRFVFDIDVTMDGDGFIEPTVKPDTENQDLKMVAYYRKAEEGS